jgi:hypothetical protein
MDINKIELKKTLNKLKKKPMSLSSVSSLTLVKKLLLELHTDFSVFYADLIYIILNKIQFKISQK